MCEIMSKKRLIFLNTNTTQIDPLIILSKHVVLQIKKYQNKFELNGQIGHLKEKRNKTTLCQVTGFNISMQKIVVF
jgi:hypothetical protein